MWKCLGTVCECVCVGKRERKCEISNIRPWASHRCVAAGSLSYVFTRRVAVTCSEQPPEREREREARVSAGVDRPVALPVNW